MALVGLMICTWWTNEWDLTWFEGFDFLCGDHLTVSGDLISRFDVFTWALIWFVLSWPPSARHGDGLYDSYMRTDHILKDEADTGPSGLPPMPKHTVSIHTDTTRKALVYHHFIPLMENKITWELYWLTAWGCDHLSCKHFLVRAELNTAIQNTLLIKAPDPAFEPGSCW